MNIVKNAIIKAAINQIKSNRMETLINNIAHAAINKKGGTFSVHYGDQSDIKHGYWVGGASVCYIIPHEFITGAKYLKSLLARVLPKIIADRPNDAFVGVWYNEEHNAVYIEQALHFNHLGTALHEAAKYNQIAIFDIQNQKDIVLGSPTEEQKIWSFVEENYPHYFRCEMILKALDLMKLKEEKELTLEDQADLDEILLEVYTHSILNFKNKNKND